jgi:hypothetical protein
MHLQCVLLDMVEARARYVTKAFGQLVALPPAPPATLGIQLQRLEQLQQLLAMVSSTWCSVTLDYHVPA